MDQQLFREKIQQLLDKIENTDKGYMDDVIKLKQLYQENKDQSFARRTTFQELTTRPKASDKIHIVLNPNFKLMLIRRP